MQILTDACLALLAAIGIWALGRMAMDWLLESGEEPEILILVRAKGDGSGLEQVASRLLQSQFSGGIFLVDCGLNKHGQVQLKALAEKERDIRLCRPDELDNLVREADIWTRRGNKMK